MAKKEKPQPPAKIKQKRNNKGRIVDVPKPAVVGASMSDQDFHREILNVLEEIARNQQLEITLLKVIAGKPRTPTGVKISQQGASMITGTNVGGQSTFEADAILAGIADPDGFPAGSVDTWTTDDPNASIAPDSGPDGNQVVVSIPATDTQGSAPAGSPPSYNLTVSVQMPTPAGGTPPAPLTMTVNVPLIAAPPPVPDGVVINQLS